MRFAKYLQGLRKDEQGSAILEFAVSSSVLLLVIFGITDCSRAIYANHFVANGARDATRYAMVRGYTFNGTGCAATTTTACQATSANVQTFVQALTPFGITPGNVTVTTTWPGTTATGDTCNQQNHFNSPGCVVQVTVSYPFNFTFPFLPKNALLLTNSSAVTISQ